MTFQLLEACSCLGGAKATIHFCPDFIAVGSRFVSTRGNAEFCHPREEMTETRSGTAESWKVIYVCTTCYSRDNHHLA